METFKSNKDKSSDELAFDYRTLRLIIGALAFAFPSTVIALTGKITTSISASYYEEGNRNVFVGFLFILGALLIAYKGHEQGEPRQESQSLWAWVLSLLPFKWLNVYQENLISTIGGMAAIFTALYPTACDGCTVTSQTRIHTLGASILFATVVYFSLVAFLRSVNKKLVEENPDFEDPNKPFRHSWFATIPNFLKIASQIRQSYDENNTVQIAKAWLSNEDRKNPARFAKALADVKANKKPNKLKFMLIAYDKKIVRGRVYLFCGPVIAVTLGVYIWLVATQSDLVAQSTITFWVETIALGFFGIAWMFASKLEYGKQLQAFFQPSSEDTSTAKTSPAAQADAE